MSGEPVAETEWTREWERTLRHTNWIERGGKFFPIGTRPAEMNGKREALPPGWARAASLAARVARARLP